MDVQQAVCLAPLALLAMREINADGFVLYGYEKGGACPVLLCGCGLEVPAQQQEGLSVSRFPLRVENREVGWLAFVFRAEHLDGAAICVFRYPRNQAIAARQTQRRFRLAKAHHGPRPMPRRESAPVDGDFASRNGRCGRDPVNVRDAVSFRRGAEPEFHSS